MNRLYKHEDVVQMLVDVIEQIEENEGIEIVDRPMGWESVRDYAEEVVSDMPSAENKGEWIFQECNDEFYGRAYECSICGVAVVGNHHNFCPNCGARMKGADDAYDK